MTLQLSHKIENDMFILFMSPPQFTQPDGFKKTFIHIDISVFFYFFYICACRCVRPCVPSHKHAPSVKMHMFVNVVYVLQETSSVLHFHLNTFCTISLLFKRDRAQTGKKERMKRKKNPNARSGLSSRRTHLTGNIKLMNT